MEDDILFASPSDASYNDIYNAVYDALNDFYNDYNDDVFNDNVKDSVLDFDDSTDDKLYTVGVQAPLSSLEEQNTAYLLDVRNLLLIFLLIWFVYTFYSKLKHVIFRFHGSRR